jgi:hypothetical protein
LFQALIAGQEYALRTDVAVALAASGASFGNAEVPFRATLRAVFEFFDADRAATKLLFRDAYAKNNPAGAADFIVSLVMKGLRPG